MPSLSAPKQAQISRKLQALGVSVQSLPSFAQLIGTEQLIENLMPVSPGRYLGRSQLDDALASSSTGYGDRAVLVSGAGRVCRVGTLPSADGAAPRKTGAV